MITNHCFEICIHSTDTKIAHDHIKSQCPKCHFLFRFSFGIYFRLHINEIAKMWNTRSYDHSWVATETLICIDYVFKRHRNFVEIYVCEYITQATRSISELCIAMCSLLFEYSQRILEYIQYLYHGKKKKTSVCHTCFTLTCYISALCFCCAQVDRFDTACLVRSFGSNFVEILVIIWVNSSAISR